MQIFIFSQYSIKSVKQVALTLNTNSFEIYGHKNFTNMSFLNEQKNNTQNLDDIEN